MKGSIQILKEIPLVEGHTVTENGKRSTISDAKIIIYKINEHKVGTPILVKSMKEEDLYADSDDTEDYNKD
ncbi:hypothetical protein [Bacillus sp. D48C]